MDHTIKHLSATEKELSVTFPVSEVAERLRNTFKRLALTVTIPGFRPGKIPAAVIQQRYGKAVREETEQHLLESGLQEVAEKEKLRPFRYADINKSGPVADGAPFSFSCRVEVFPDTGATVRDLTVEWTPIPLREHLIDEEIEAFRRRQVSFTAADRPAQEKDRATITFEGSVDGEKRPGLSGADVPVLLGEKNFLPEIETALAGRRAGDKFDLTVNFPETFHAKDLAGKAVDFSIEVRSVEEPRLPELTDELVAQHEPKAKTVAELRDQIRRDIERYLDELNLEQKRHLTLDRYLKEYPFDLPPSLLSSEIAVREKEHLEKNPGAALSDEDQQKMARDAETAIRRFILLSQLAETLSVTVSERDIEREIEKEAARYHIPVEHYKRYLDQGRWEQKRLALRDERVIDKLVEKARFIEKPLDESKKEQP